MAALYNGALLALAISARSVQAARFGHAEHGARQGPGTIELNPALSFDRIANMTTCESATVQWFYAGPSSDMTLSVTNLDVEQVALPPAPSTTSSTSSTPTPPPLENGRDRRAAPFVDMVISERVNPTSSSFRWASVNIASGSYILQAKIAAEDFLAESPVFHVLTGRNTACLAASNPSSSATTSGASTSSGTGPNSPPAQTSGSWVPGAVSGSSRNPINTGAIIGIVLGVLAMTVIGVGAYFFMRNRKRKEQNGFGGKKWNHLNSTDSRGGLMFGGAAENPHRASRGLSSAQRRANYSHGSSTGHTVQGSQDTIAEKELGSTDYSSRKNSVASYDSNVMALSTLPSLHLHNNPSHGYEEGDSPSPKRRRPSYSDAAATANAAVRRSSSDRKPPRPYLPTIESTHNSLSGTPSLEGTSFSHNAYEMQPPSSPSPVSADAKRTNRQSLGGRKRKPVPAYDPGSDSPAVPSTPSSSTPLDSRSYQSHDAGYVHQPQPQSPYQGSSVGHYATRAGRSGTSTPDGSDLLHKSSLGIDGKPVHYLMPDLPADQR